MTEQIVHDDVSTKRRMPDNLRRFLLKVQGGKMYLPAAYRLVWFRDERPDWGISTVIIEGGQEAGFATVQATVCNSGGCIIATGHKTETKADFPAGWVEKAETGAIARALAVAGFGTQFSPELDEVVDAATGEVKRPADSPLGNGSEPVRGPSADLTWHGPGQCPTCRAPEGRPHGTKCLGTLIDAPRPVGGPAH